MNVSLLLLGSFITFHPILDVKVLGPMRPLESEKLIAPVQLNCQNVKIVEWKATPGYLQTSNISEKSIGFLNKICQKTVKGFHTFVISQGYRLTNDVENFSPSVSLLPARLDRFGSDYRNLNDSQFRFYNRSRQLDENGNVIPIWGYFQRSVQHIYIRNDIFNDDGTPNLEFRTAFSHELFHSLSYQTGIFQQHNEETEEKLAQKFTNWLGFGG